MASSFWNTLAWLIIFQPFIILLHCIVPINNIVLCQVANFIPTMIPLFGLLMHDAIIVVKYVFIFHLKNPTALQDDFWSLFINAWIWGFCFITQVGFSLAPGRDTLGYYICIGKINLKMMEEPRKINYALNIAGNLSVMLHAAFWVLKKTYKYYNGKKYKLYKDYEFKLANIASKANMFHFISHIVTIFFLIIGLIYFPRIYMHMHPQKIDSFPNYILVYFQDMIMGNLCILSVLIIRFRNSASLRREVRQELWELIPLLQYFPQNI